MTTKLAAVLNRIESVEYLPGADSEQAEVTGFSRVVHFGAPDVHATIPLGFREWQTLGRPERILVTIEAA